jgi:hypothetical protein
MKATTKSAASVNSTKAVTPVVMRIHTANLEGHPCRYVIGKEKKRFFLVSDIIGIFGRTCLAKLSLNDVLLHRITDKETGNSQTRRIVSAEKIRSLKLVPKQQAAAVPTATKVVVTPVLAEEILTLAAASVNQAKASIKRKVNNYATTLFRNRNVDRNDLSAEQQDEVYREAYQTLYVEFRRILGPKLVAAGSSLKELGIGDKPAKGEKADYLTRVERAGFLTELKNVANELFRFTPEKSGSSK